MKIKSIALSNFGLFEEGSMQFTEPVTYFTGANRRGKSTILKAIGWAMTGVAPETGADGRNSESMVRIGQPVSSMCVVLDTDKGELARRVGDTLKSKAGVDIAKRLGVPPEVAMVCLAWNSFITMPPDKARVLLLGLLGVEVTTENLKALLGDDASYLPPVGKYAGPEVIAAAYKAAYQDRAAVRGAIKAIVKPDLSQFPDDVRSLTVTEAEQYLREDRQLLRELEKDLEHSIASNANAAGAQTGEHAAFVARKEAATARMDKVKLKIAAIGAMPDLGKLDKASKAAEKELATFLEAKNALVAAIAVSEAEVKRLRLRQEAFASNTAGRKAHTCPTCSTALSKDAYDAIVNSVVTEMMAEEAKLAAAQEELVLLGKSDAQSKADKAANAVIVGRSIQEKAKTLSDEQHEIAAELAEIESDMAAASAEEPPQDGQLPLAVPDQIDLGAIRARISKGQGIIMIWERYIPERKRADTYEKDLAAAKAKEAALDRLVEALSPKGKIMTSMIEPKMAPFFNAINQALEPFGYGATLDLSEGFALTIQDGTDGPWVPFRSISDSEMVRLGFAIQVAFACSSGFGLVVTDQVDRLDADSRVSMIEAVDLALKGGVNQVILAGTMSEPEGRFSEPTIPGWQFLEIG